MNPCLHLAELQRGRFPAAPGPTGCCTIPELILLMLLQCFHVPYSALTMFISREQSERDSATAYRKNISFPSLLWLGGSHAWLLHCGSCWGTILLRCPAGRAHLIAPCPKVWCVMNIVQGLNCWFSSFHSSSLAPPADVLV